MESFNMNRSILMLCNNFLNLYDRRLIYHGERVANIVDTLLPYYNRKHLIDYKHAILLSLFHDIGAYKTEEVDRMVHFESEDVERHSIYGYLFLKYFTSMHRLAKTILYHHTPYAKMEDVTDEIKAYAELIHMADRIDIGVMSGYTAEKIYEMLQTMDFTPEVLLAYKSTFLVNPSLLEFSELAHRGWVEHTYNNLEFSLEEVSYFLEMMIHSIDFVSETTRLHSTNVMVISKFVGTILNLSEGDMNRLYYASLIHDVGKIAIPHTILESPHRLNSKEMEIMRTHVTYTEQMARGLLPDDIVDIAVRHHEKLDGSGYPYGLTAKSLSLLDRILAVADIVSALASNRSYKQAFSWNKIFDIICAMVSDGLLDEHIVEIIIQHQSELQVAMDIDAKRILSIYQNIYEEFEQISKVINIEKSGRTDQVKQ